jgi:hypothetical protein
MIFVKYKQINSYYVDWQTEFVKFKEFYYDKSINQYVPTQGNTFIAFNMNKIDEIIVLENDFVQINGRVGMFCVEKL